MKDLRRHRSARVYDESIRHEIAAARLGRPAVEIRRNEHVSAVEFAVGDQPVRRAEHSPAAPAPCQTVGRFGGRVGNGAEPNVSDRVERLGMNVRDEVRAYEGDASRRLIGHQLVALLCVPTAERRTLPVRRQLPPRVTAKEVFQSAVRNAHLAG